MSSRLRSYSINRVIGLALCGLSLAALAPSAAHAQTTFYGDRPTFLGNSAGTTTVDFEGIAPEDGFNYYPTPPGLTLSGVHFTLDPAVSNGSLFVIGKDFYYPGNSVLSSQASTTGTEDLHITFAAPVTALGLDFGDNFVSQAFAFTLSDGETFSRLAPTGTALDFVGLTTTTPITSLDIQTASGTGALNIDNVTFGQAAPVPEASTTVSLGLLLAFGMSGIVVASKRKKTGTASA